MSILQKQRTKDQSAGWARDFLAQVEPLLGEIKARGTRIVTNAGGVNPRGCAEALLAAARARGLGLRVAVVAGDDVLERIGELRAAGADLRNMETGEAFDTVAERLVAANAYFGALPVREALRLDPDIVVCGRVTDTGITLGAMMRRVRLGRGRLRPAGGGDRGGPHHRVRHAGLGRQLHGLAEGPVVRGDGVPAPRVLRGRLVRRDEAAGDRRARHAEAPSASSCSTRWATPTPTSRPTASPTSRRSRSSGTARTASACPGSAGGRPRRS